MNAASTMSTHTTSKSVIGWVSYLCDTSDVTTTAVVKGVPPASS
jgi:hypothetical protein